MRKLTAIFLSFCLSLIAPVSAFAAKDTGSAWLNEEEIGKGVIGVHYEAASGANLKVMVSKDGTSYTYDLKNDGTEEFFPLQLGNGSYKIMVLEHTTGNKYKSVHTATRELAAMDEASTYLNAVQNVNWAAAEEVSAKAKELTGGLKDEESKAQAIYDYITAAVTYDYELAAVVEAGYIPDLDKVLSGGKGICYDYASLFAAMARSVGIPTKLVMGSSDYVTDYHAWNEVLLNGSWVTVDTTVDAAAGSSAFAKDAAKYSGAKVY
jgi:transglutaminase-like putative cysteine protease